MKMQANNIMLLFVIFISTLKLCLANEEWCTNGCFCFEDDKQIKFADCSRQNSINIDADMFGKEFYMNVLDLSYNLLSELEDNFPDNIKGRQRITVLSLAHNAISSISPQAFNGYVSLKALDLSYNRISSLPPELFLNLPQMNILSLEGNRLKTEQGGNGWLLNAPNLTKLSLAHCNLGHLSDVALSRLNSLISLDISDNELTQLPGKFPSTLKILILNDNRLECTDVILRSLKSEIEVEDNMCESTKNEPGIKMFESMKMLPSGSSSSIFSDILCNPITASKESLEDEDTELELNSNIKCKLPNNSVLNLWGMPALWAAICSFLTGIMVSAWVVWCFVTCGQPTRIHTNSLTSESNTNLLASDSTLSVFTDGINEPPGTPPPPYISAMT